MGLKQIRQELAAFVCSHVFSDTSPVLLVAREEGDWMFLCGAEHVSEEDYHIVGIGHLTDRDPSLSEVMDLLENTEAERSGVGNPWIRVRIDHREQ